MPYQLPTLQELIENFEKNLAAELSKIPNGSTKMPLSVQKAYSRTNGYALNALYGFVKYMSKQIIPTTSEGEYLRRHCSGIGLYPKQASKSTGTIKVTGTVGNSIAAGELLNREDGWQYAVLETVTLSETEQSIKVVATKAGAAGNCEAGTILTFVNALEGISPTATVELIGAGADAETDKDLLSRYVEYMRNLYMGGADSDYKKWALEVEGVNRAWVYPHTMGAGTVTVRIMTPTGFPDEELLRKVKEHIDSKRPVTVKRIFVLAPAAKAIDIEIANLDPDTPEMKEAIIQSLQQSFDANAEPGGLVLVSRIHSAILSTINLVDYKLVSPTENIQCAAGEIAMLGDVTWS